MTKPRLWYPPKHALWCKLCASFVVSLHRHDFRWCECKSCALDGGNDYVKVTGNAGTWEIVNIKTTENVEDESI